MFYFSMFETNSWVNVRAESVPLQNFHDMSGGQIAGMRVKTDKISVASQGKMESKFRAFIRIRI